MTRSAQKIWNLGRSTTPPVLRGVCEKGLVHPLCVCVYVCVGNWAETINSESPAQAICPPIQLSGGVIEGEGGGVVVVGKAATK